MSTQNARDTHFFLAGWNGHIENPNATTHFLQAMKSAPTPTAPLAAEHTTRSDTDALARTETAARFLLGWKYGQMPTCPDTLLRQSAHVKPQWAWNAACKLLRFIDGSAPAEVHAVATEPLGPVRPAEGAPEPAPVAHHCTARTADGSCEECEGHTQAMAAWNAERAALAAMPLPLLVRDIARDIGITVPQACIALKPLGNYSTNSAVTAEMARMLREHFPDPARATERVRTPATLHEQSLTDEQIEQAFIAARDEFMLREVERRTDKQLRLAFGRSVLKAALAATPAAPELHREWRSAFQEAIDTMEAEIDSRSDAENVRRMKRATSVLRSMLADTPAAPAPSDEAIMAWAMEQQTDAIKALRASGFVRVARAVLARWAAGVPAAAPDALTQAARDVLAERARQISAEGWTPEHDDEHSGHEMAHAAACYAYPQLTALVGVKTWPWAPEWFKVRDHRSNYVRAGALILAEIERVDRAAIAAQAGKEST